MTAWPVGSGWPRNSISNASPPAPATGTLMKKIHSQPMLSQMMPPRIGPATGPTRVVIAQSTVA